MTPTPPLPGEESVTPTPPPLPANESAESTSPPSSPVSGEPLEIRLTHSAPDVQLSDAKVRLAQAALGQFTDELDADTELARKVGKDKVWFDPEFTMGGTGGVFVKIGVYVPDDATSKRLRERFRKILSCLD